MNSLGLYIHVPFCRRKCAYCDFYSVPRGELIPAYVEKTLAHLAFRSERAKGYEVDTVYFGGGTPGLLSPEDWRRLLGAVKERFSVSENAEITAEMNPESATPEGIAAFCEGGGNRLSLGMQSADEKTLAALGRRHRFPDVVRAVETARAAGVENLSLDLMYALPGETPALWRSSLEKAVALSPEHLSLYCLTLSPETPLWARRGELPDEEAQREAYLSAVSFLREKGYGQYEISNFARPGFESRHNLRYWRRLPYLGIGPAAHSFFENERFFTAADLDAYLASDPSEALIRERSALTPEDEDEERIMLSLRLAEGLDLSSVRDGEKRRRAAEKLALYARAGLCRETEKGYALTPEGFFVSNAILAELI